MEDKDEDKGDSEFEGSFGGFFWGNSLVPNVPVPSLKSPDSRTIGSC
jgi:hypothetical protein